MKKFLSISLVVVMVLALGSMAFAAEGSLAGGATLEANIDVHATVGPYAEITTGNSVRFGTLLGKVGLYTANTFDGGEEFYERAADVFGIPKELVGNNPGGYGEFWIEANTDVNVGIEFDNTGWLASPTLFAIAKGGVPSVALAWAGSNADLTGQDTFFAKSYEPGKQYYGIDGAIWIESISQQEAASYTGKITITVSK